MEFTDFVSKVSSTHIPGQREGQKAFNLLLDCRPDLAEKIRGNMNLDPFYRDDRLKPFFSWVMDNWNN